MSDDPLADDLEKIARKMAKDIADSGDVNPDYVTAFRALSGYYTSTRKLGKKQDVDDTPGFAGVKSAIAAASHRVIGNGIERSEPETC